MFITKKKHRKIVEGYKERIKTLEERCNLKSILDKVMVDSLTVGTLKSTLGSNFDFTSTGVTYNFPDNVAVYEKDYFGGKVIKQEATKVVAISQDGNVEYGLTKQAPDKGYKYKLVRK